MLQRGYRCPSPTVPISLRHQKYRLTKGTTGNRRHTLTTYRTVLVPSVQPIPVHTSRGHPTPCIAMCRKPRVTRSCYCAVLLSSLCTLSAGYHPFQSRGIHPLRFAHDELLPNFGRGGGGVTHSLQLAGLVEPAGVSSFPPHEARYQECPKMVHRVKTIMTYFVYPVPLSRRNASLQPLWGYSPQSAVKPGAACAPSE